MLSFYKQLSILLFILGVMIAMLSLTMKADVRPEAFELGILLGLSSMIIYPLTDIAESLRKKQ